jgi:hypothetical protein
MSSKSQNDNLPAINQLILRLETNRFLVLNKTEDQYFDDFFLKQFAANDRTNRVWALEINKLLTN